MYCSKAWGTGESKGLKEKVLRRNPHPGAARRRPAEQPCLAASPTVTRQTPRVIIGLWPHTSPVTLSLSILVKYTVLPTPLCGILCPCNGGSLFAYFGCDRIIHFLHSTISVCTRVPFLSKTCLGEVFSVLFLKVSLEVCHRSHLEDRENTNLLKGPNRHCIHFNIMLNINL